MKICRKAENAWEYFAFLDSFPQGTGEKIKKKEISQLFELWSLFGTEEFTCLSGAAVPRDYLWISSQKLRRGSSEVKRWLAGGLSWAFRDDGVFSFQCKNSPFLVPIPIRFKKLLICVFICWMLLLNVKRMNRKDVADFWHLTRRYLDPQSNWNYRIIYDDMFTLALALGFRMMMMLMLVNREAISCVWLNHKSFFILEELIVFIETWDRLMITCQVDEKMPKFKIILVSSFQTFFRYIFIEYTIFLVKFTYPFTAVYVSKKENANEMFKQPWVAGE